MIHRINQAIDRLLETAVQAGLHVDPEDYQPGSHEIEPYFAVESGEETLVIEGDYTKGTIRCRDLDGRLVAEVTATLDLEPLVHAFRVSGFLQPADFNDTDVAGL